MISFWGKSKEQLTIWIARAGCSSVMGSTEHLHCVTQQSRSQSSCHQRVQEPQLLLCHVNLCLGAQLVWCWPLPAVLGSIRLSRRGAVWTSGFWESWLPAQPPGCKQIMGGRVQICAQQKWEQRQQHFEGKPRAHISFYKHSFLSQGILFFLFFWKFDFCWLNFNQFLFLSQLASHSIKVLHLCLGIRDPCPFWEDLF